MHSYARFPMTIRPLVLPALFFATMVCAVQASEPVGSDTAEKEVTELEEQMDRMNTAFRKLRRQAGDPTKNESSLELVTTMQDVIPAALALTPAKAADLPESERAGFIEGYQAGLEKLSTVLTKLEVALKADNNADAVGLISDLRAAQKAGHREYKKPDRD